MPGGPYGAGEAQLNAIEKIAGAKPPTCPWQAYSDPLVGEVLDLWRAAQTGMGAHLASVLALNPPHILWDGLQHYAFAVAKVRENHDELAGK